MVAPAAAATAATAAALAIALAAVDALVDVDLAVVVKAGLIYFQEVDFILGGQLLLYFG